MENCLRFYLWSKRFRIFYKLNCILFNADIHPRAIIPQSTKFCHNGRGVVIGENVRLGENCEIYPYVLIGERKGKNPWIGDNVRICAKATIVGELVIPSNTKIGIGEVVKG